MDMKEVRTRQIGSTGRACNAPGAFFVSRLSSESEKELIKKVLIPFSLTRLFSSG